MERDENELRFARGMIGIFTLIGFFLLYFGFAPLIGKILIILTSFLLLFAGATGICIASLMYALLFKKSQKNTSQ